MFFFVREFFERLLLVYRDKFVGKMIFFYEGVGKKIVYEVCGDFMRNNISERLIFDEFIFYFDWLFDWFIWDMYW